MFAVSLSLLNFCELYNFGAHPLAMDAHSGNARGSNANALAPARVNTHTLPTHARANPPAKEERGASGTPLDKILKKKRHSQKFFHECLSDKSSLEFS